MSSPKLIEHARAMRSRPTPAEHLLWRRLRGRQLGMRFRRQHPVAGYILDFYCPQAKLAVELDGGGHTSSQQLAHDRERAERLAELGITVLRIWNPEVVHQQDAVLELIAAGLRGEPIPRRRSRVDQLIG